ncbi:MAG: hypothetical protein NVS4B12_15440 [Ktedonobacteraceae bacterium]
MNFEVTEIDDIEGVIEGCESRPSNLLMLKKLRISIEDVDDDVEDIFQVSLDFIPKPDLSTSSRITNHFLKLLISKTQGRDEGEPGKRKMPEESSSFD